MSDDDCERWDARYRERGDRVQDPSTFLIGLDDVLPRRGRAIDVAGGAGRNALWLARRGLDVTLVDLSSVALEIARGAAAREELPLHTLAADLEDGAFPEGPWDLIVCIDFLWRPLFQDFFKGLASGGLLVVVHPTLTNLERHEHPGPRFLLDDGELLRLIPDFHVVFYQEGWTTAGRHEATLAARRPFAGAS